VSNLHAKFEVSSFTVLEIWRVSQNLKSRSRDHFTTPFDLILHFFDRTPMANLCAKFEVSSFNRSRYIKGSQNFKK